MVGTWMLWQNGCGLGGRYYGWDLDALAERMKSGWTISWWDLAALAERMRSGWTISWLGPGCSGRTDGVWVDDTMVGTWMLWQNGWGLGGRYHGWDLDALAERMGSGWTISWLGPGCSGRTDAVWVDDIMVGTWMLWQNGWGLGGRYHDWELDALAVRMGSGAQSCEEVGPGRAEGQRRKEGVGKRPGRCLFIVSGASKPYSNHSGPYIIVRL